MIQHTFANDIFEIQLGTPPCNEIGSTFTHELGRIILEIRKLNPKVVILHSAIEGGFCAGADLREFYQGILSHPLDEAMVKLRTFLDDIHRVMNTLDTMPMPTIGVIHGVCFGGGFELALTCDVLVAESSARFCFPELRLGIVPGFGGIPRLRREVGNSVVRDLLFTGRSINADKAQTLGLVSQVVQPKKGLDVARKMAAQMSRYDAQVMAKAKAFMKQIPLEELEREKELFLEMFRSPAVLAGLKKFVESTDLRPYLA